MICPHCQSVPESLTLEGHLRKCSIYLALPRKLQRCACKYQPVSLADRAAHRLVCTYSSPKASLSEQECTKCRIIKPIHEFAVNKIKKSGHDSSCKQCRKSAKKKYDAKALNALNRLNYDPSSKKEYYEKNKERIASTKKVYWTSHKFLIQERTRQWREDNESLLREKAKAKRDSINEQVIALLGGVCTLCGIADKDLLTIDHVNGDGNQDRKLVASQSLKLRLFKGTRSTAGLRLLCHSCNISAYVRNPHHHLKKGVVNTKPCSACKQTRPQFLVTDGICSPCHSMRDLVLKAECFQLMGSKCANCPEQDISKLCLDHINNNGSRMRRLHRSGVDLYRKIIRGQTPTDAFAILCFNCNYLKNRNPSLLKEVVADYQVRELVFKEITSDLASDFCETYHYIGYGRGGTHHFGLFDGEELVGVFKLATVVRKEVAESLGFKHDEVCELDRLCLHPRYHKMNTASRFLSKAENALRKLRKYSALVAFADTTAGHNGGVYKGSNFEYLGKTAPSYTFFDVYGNEVGKKAVYDQAVRSGMKEREYAESLHYTKVYTPPKMKFVRRFTKPGGKDGRSK